MDYVTGFGRFHAFASDGFSWYTGGVGTTLLMQLSSAGAISTATWTGGLIAGQYGGTGVANTGKTITLGGNLTTSGAFATTFTTTAITSLTLPVSGTVLSSTTAPAANPITGTPTVDTYLSGNGTWATLGTGVATALAINIGTAGSFVVYNNALGTPSSGVVTNLTGTASININGTVGATTPTTVVATTATANSFIPNSATIPTNGVYLPAANSVGIATNSTNRVTVDAIGTLGVGVTPSVWGTGVSAVQIGTKTTIYQGTGGGVSLANNNYINTTPANTYITTAAASNFNLTPTGAFSWLQAASGTAGTAITFTTSMTLSATGGLSLGNIVDPGATNLSVTGTGTFGGIIKPQQATTAGAPAYVKGAIYFDTTLNKLRVGGATAWETITSV